MDPVTTTPVEDYLVLPDAVDLNNCDREAIHIPGGVQPHGALLALPDGGATVVVASATASDVLGVQGPALGASLPDLFDGDSTAAILRALDTGGLQRRHLVVRSVAGVVLDAVLHRSQGHGVVELEPHDPDLDGGWLFDEVSDVSSTLVGGVSLASARGAVARSVRRLTGFDRVMVYLFHEDGHGEVVAEARRDDLEPFLGLHYPATDVPRQARLLYVRNWTRLIADANAEAVPLLPDRFPGSGEPINLAHAQLRAVSPIHLEYLRNMGVATSMSLSLVDDGELVGLIACHHQTPRTVPFVVRSACELLARLISEQLSRAAARDREEREQERRRIQLGVLRHVAESGSTHGALVGVERRTLQPLAATAFHARIGDVDHASGPMPFGVEVVERLLASSDDDVVSVEDAQPHGAPPGAGGLLAARIGRDGHLAWFRPPVARTLTWGGDPDAGSDPDTGEKLRPRASFEAYADTVRGRCSPWSQRDRRLAETLRRVLDTSDLDQPDERDLTTVVQSLTAYADELEAANEELLRSATAREEMISAVAHDLRGPLRTITGFTGIIAERAAGDESITPIAERVSDAAGHMSALLDGLQRWGRLGDTITPTTVDLTQAVRTVLEGLRHALDQTGAVVEVAELAAVRGDAMLLRELMQNLVENAVKYRHPDRRPHITVVTEPMGGGAVRLTVADNGIGIPPDRVDDVFRVFRQLRPDRDDGIGLGLALVQRIAERHGGRAWVDSVVGTGTTFHVRLTAAEEAP